ncbi:TIGR02117 family protein [Sphingomonas immobilis]|uniref:TIGR02117 family protein n=1 Tax=Sphingomonas immobilis TaxID=3063997 RepID=A0ABT9A3J5_9SPHN|nr:TIGR02117 family protein [Sphingomonas sp. CA1-15]MDO7843307.1 TIGR02117 family protein [Sphingomonas sp. CA1-15]
MARRGLRGIGWLAAALFLLVLAYAAAGMVGGAIPANAGWRAPPEGVRIAVSSNGVHTGLIVPVAAAGVDWRDLVRPEDIADPRYAALDSLEIGWGERTFYLETATWADAKPLTILSAAIGSRRTVMHVDHLRFPAASDDVRHITLRPEEYRRLAAFVRASFGQSAPGTRGWHRTGYFKNDAFYEANGTYSALYTCNTWTGDALKHAGVRVGAWTPFPATVLGWFR